MNMQGTTNRYVMFWVRGENMFSSILVLQTGHSVLGIMFYDNVKKINYEELGIMFYDNVTRY